MTLSARRLPLETGPSERRQPTRPRPSRRHAGNTGSSGPGDCNPRRRGDQLLQELKTLAIESSTEMCRSGKVAA